MKRYLVESAAIRQNLETLKKRAGKARLFAVVKGNGYGLGLVPLAAICRDAGVDTFCVTEVSDATQLRGAGFTQQILMIRPTCDVDEVHQLLDLDVVLTVSSQDDAAVLNGIATQRKQKVKAHIEIDTGMGRYGFLPGEMDKLLHIYSYMDGLDLCGIYTHFHSAFCNKKATDLQMVCFRSVIRQLQEKGKRVDPKRILKEIVERDEQDMNRAIAPLKCAPDAIRVDSSELTQEQTVQKLLALIRERIG